MYATRDVGGNITGHTRWPNDQSDVKIDTASDEWVNYLDNKTQEERRMEARGSVSDRVIDILLDKGLIAEAALTQEEADGLASRKAKRAT